MTFEHHSIIISIIIITAITITIVVIIIIIRQFRLFISGKIKQIFPSPGMDLIEVLVTIEIPYVTTFQHSHSALPNVSFTTLSLTCLRNSHRS